MLLASTGAVDGYKIKKDSQIGLVITIFVATM
jgi:hypothetical protein